MLSFYAPGRRRIEAAPEFVPAEVNWIDALRPTGEEIAFFEARPPDRGANAANSFRNRILEQAGQGVRLAASQRACALPRGWILAGAHTSRFGDVEGRTADGEIPPLKSLR